MSRFAEEISKLSKQRLALLCVELQRELHAARQSRPEPIAIIGLGCRLPGGVNGPEEFWHLLENGIDAIGPIPSDRWNVDEVYDPVRTAPGKIYTRSGGFVDRVDEFDPEFFGISPREARHMDPQHRLLLEVAWEALEHAGQPIDQLAGSPSGVFIGIGTYDYATWQTAYLTHESVNAYTGTGNAFCFAAGRLSYLLGLHGPSLALDAACATSLVAVHLACQSLRAGECTLALAGGVNLMLTPEPTIFLSKAQALSPDGRCKTFDASADGYGRGEGCGIVVLKRLSDAIAAGDPVLAVIRGSAVNHDGRSAGLTVPNGTAQQAVIREALAQAGVSPRDISYVEAHGTGTALGDPIEIRALSAVLGRNRDADNPLWIGAVKTNIGHLEVAAGVANLMKVALALQHRTIPPHLHYRQPNPHIAFDEIPARIPVTAVPWPNGRGPRLAGVSSFGLSGTNAHVVVEEFRPTVEEHATADDHGGPHVLTLSARDEWSLRALASACEQSLAPGGMLREMPLSDICYTASARRSHHRYRWAAVVDSIEEARRKLAAFASQASTEGSPSVPARREHKLAFVFAGQGSQWWAMGRDLMAKEPVFLHAIEECDEIFRRHGHISILEELRRDEATSRISDTEIAQPALFAVQVALVRLLASWGVHPDSVIGHSAGEVAAAHAAGVLTLEDAARLALLRGRVMQQATGQGSMAAVELGEAEAEALAGRFPGQLAVAAMNSPSSSVLSGDTDAMLSALSELEARGVWHRMLPVNYSFHSHQMWRLRTELLEAIGGLKPRASTIPIVSTVTGREADGASFDAHYWVRNLTDPVRFAAGIQTLAADRHDVFLEIGPQPVLRKPVVECLEAAGRVASVMSSLRRGVDERSALLKTLANLYTLGFAVEWRPLYDGTARVVQLPRYPWHRRRLWVEPDRVHPLASGNGRVPEKVQDPGAEDGPATESQILDYVHELRWEQVERQAPRADSDQAGAWLVFADRNGTAAALAEAMRARGETCELVCASAEGIRPPNDVHAIDPTSGPAFRDLLKSRQAAQPFRGIVYLWGLDAEIDDDASARRVYGGLLNIVQAAGPAGWRARQIWVVTRGCQPVITSVAPEALGQAPLWGMVRTIPLELPGISCIGVDLDPREDANAIGMLADELQQWDGVDQIALRSGQRYLPRLHRHVAAPRARDAHSIAGDATYLITGGTGALGLKVARWMVDKGARHLALMSRSGLSQDVTPLVDELRSAGADVRVLQGDVASRQDVARILEEIDRTMAPLRGIVHAAGINDVGFIERQPWASFEAVFPSKVRGAWNLHTLTGTRSLDFFLLFSSTAAVFGGLGQANYSGANAFLDSLAHYRRSCGLPALAIDWGPWAEVGMAARLGEQVRRRWAAQGVRMMSPAHAIATLAYLMRVETPQAIATSIDWPTFVRGYPQIERVSLFAAMRAENPAGIEALDSSASIDLRRRLAEAGADEARELVQDYVRYQFAEALGFEPSHPLDPELNFLEMGVDSLVATRVMLVLNETLRVNLAVSVMFEHPTIATLAAEVNRVRIIAAPSAGDCAAHDSSHVETVEAPPWLSAPVIGEDQTADARAAEETSMVHDDDVNAAPLSSAQQRIWFVNKFETYEPAYNEPLILRMTGNLQVPVMVAALEEIARRHEILRTIFRHDQDGPVQVVLPPAPLDMTVDDLLAIPETEREGHLWQALSDEVRRPFDLSLGPLWRARLFRVRENEHVLALVLHHIITDGWSHGVLAREAMTLYMAYSTGPRPSAAAALGTPGRPSPLPTLPIQYRHYARRQRQQLEGERVQSQLQYWERQLAGLPVLEWPFLPARRARQTFRGALHSFLIPRATAEQLTALSQRERTTLFMTLLAAFFVLLYRHTRQSDFAVGTPVAGRTATDTKPLLGLFLNLLVLRAKVDGSITFRELLARVRQTSLEAFDHQDVPFDHLIDEMGIRRDLSRSPLFQVMFVLQNTPLPKLSVGGLEVEQLKVDRGTSKLDFTLSIEPTSRGLEGFIEYSTDIFDASLMAAMMRHYQQILEGIIAQPDQRVAELPLLTANERDQIVTTWNASAQVWPDPTANSLVAWLESQAARTPNAIAVWTDASPENRAPIPEPEMWTYATLHARANQIARRLQRLGVGAESRVGVWLPRSPQMVAALIGVLKAGGAYLPLDPSYPAARLAFQVADAQVAVVLTSTECAADVPPGAYAIEVVDAPDAAWRQEAQTAPAVRVSPDQLAYVIYTSGSTGQPKGAMNSHRGIGNRLAWMQATYGLTAADRVLQKTSINFDVSVWELFLPLGTGATLVVAKPGGQNDPAYLADIIQRAGVTVLHFVPAMLEAFVTAGGLTSCGRVRLMVCSGEALPGPLAARCLTAWPGQLENLYGPTEAAVDVTWQPCTPKVTSAAIVPIGRPVANTQVYVRDAVGQPVPAGVVGELYLGGVQVGRGYWARPDLTAERFVPDPFSTIPGARLYRTGDLARYRSDGVVEYVGRIDQQVKLRGNRIELGEIEAVLRQQPGIRDAAVVLREDESGARRLVGYVVPAGPAAEVVIETLRQQLRAQLPEYMVPAAIVALDALPLNPNGKVDRRALPEPGPMRPALKVEFVAPRNELERLLADIEAEVLGLDRVGIHDNFFDLGGASLSGLDIMSRLNEAGIAVEPMQLFEYQTVAELAAALIESGAAVGDASPQALDIGLGIQVPSPEPQAPSVI